MNPARAFAPALIAGEFGPGASFLTVCVAAPVAGALAAAYAYAAVALERATLLRPVELANCGP